MPSILVELGFLSNAKEEEYLIQGYTQELMAVSLYNAFTEYKNLIEGTNKPKKELPINKQGATIVKQEPSTSSTTLPKPAENEKNNPNANSNLSSTTEGIVFKVQFYTSSAQMSIQHKKFAGISEVEVYFENNLWKYTSGNERDYEKAKKILNDVKKKFPDAFIIAYHAGKKIPLSEAQKLLKK